MQEGYHRYLEPSIKGSTEVDWSDPEARRGFLAAIVADAAYGDGETRRQFAEAEGTLVAKVPKPPHSPYFTKQDFHIALEAGCCTCPAGEVTNRLHRQGRDRDGYGKQVPRRAFVFEGAVCDGCPLRSQCVKAAPGRGRSVSLHAQEGLLQEAIGEGCLRCISGHGRQQHSGLRP